MFKSIQVHRKFFFVHFSKVISYFIFVFNFLSPNNTATLPKFLFSKNVQKYCLVWISENINK